MTAPSPLETALARVTIPDVWHALSLPGDPKKSCCSPFRAERTPSFSVFDNGRKWKDFSTADGGDVLDFVAAALGCDKATAARWLIDFAGTHRTATPRHAPRKAPTRPQVRPEEKRRPLTLPAMDRGTYGEICTLQRLRRLPFNAGLQILLDRGLLRFGTMDGHRCFFVLEGGRNAQGRRLDGKPLEAGGRAMKAKTLLGSQAAFPVGLEDARKREIVLFCEGGPDLLAAASVAWWESDGNTAALGFVAMLGAALDIPAEALPAFARKRVRVFAHNDEAGMKAARAWARQLRSAGAVVDVWASDCEGEDLNDWLTRTWAESDEPGGFAEPLIPDIKKAPTDAPAGAAN